MHGRKRDGLPQMRRGKRIEKKSFELFFFLEERKVVVERAEGFFFLALQSQALIF